MPISIQNISSRIDSCISSASPGTLNCCQIQGARCILDNSVVKVANTNLLPISSENEGRLVFVENQCKYYYSNGWEWTSCFSSIPMSQDKIIYMWGNNNCCGALGDGTTTFRTSPGTTSGTGLNWCKISTSGFVAGGIKTDGTLWTWGFNSSGELGNGSTIARSSPGTTAGGGATWCDLSIGGWGHSGGSGGHHTLAIKTDGTLWTWGINLCGALGTGTTTSRSSPGTTAGGGTTWCKVGTMAHCTSAAIKNDGTLWTWGINNCGQLGDGSIANRSSPGTVAGGGTTWCQVSSGFRHTSAIQTNGTLWTWGSNLAGVLGDGTTTSRSSPGTTAGGGTTWCQSASGFEFMAAIKTDGTLWTWGSNNCGQLGDGTNTSRSSPGTTFGGGTTWCCVSTKGNCDPSGQISSVMAGIKTDGTLWTWGLTGSGSSSLRYSPFPVSGNISSWCDVVAGSPNIIGLVNCVRGFN